MERRYSGVFHKSTEAGIAFTSDSYMVAVGVGRTVHGGTCIVEKWRDGDCGDFAAIPGVT